jgi:putative phosphoesterase
MRLAFISDIHGNFDALKAVMLDIKKNNIEKIYCLGDIVNYYYEPHKCIDLLIKKQVKCIKGNHENIFFKTLNSKKKTKFYSKIYGNSIYKNLKLLKKKHITFLKSLKTQLKFTIDNEKFFLTHASPWSINFYFYPNIKKIWFNKISKYKFNYFVLGHTHIPMAVKLNKKKIIINPGSVGQPRNKSINAQWLILDTTTKKIMPKNTAYSVKRIKNQITKYDFNNTQLLKYFK